jgi:Xaa-Pro aminopeptidase
LLSGWTELEAKRHVERTASLLGFDMSFSTIATVRGETLHNHPTTRACRHGDLFLLDAGVESEMGYAGDLTSSFPVSPSFTPRQAELYRLVLDAFESTIRTLAPNRLFLDVHREACRTIVKGLKDLGIMKGDVEEAVESGAHALFFPHGIGHLIGLDVHDMEAMGEDKVGYADTKRSSQFGLRSLRLAKALKPGMVHSVEPGIYFIPGLIDLWKAEHRFGQCIDYGTLQEWIGVGGIRIEEDWVVLSDGSRRLGPEVDKSLPAVEEARKMAYEKSPGSKE